MHLFLTSKYYDHLILACHCEEERRGNLLAWNENKKEFFFKITVQANRLPHSQIQASSQ